MPLYEYQCTSCDFNFEQRQGFDADPICDCPKCKSEARRLFKPAPIIFKGKGFYVTDYPSSSSTATSASGSSESSASSTSASPAAESKAATSATSTAD